MRLGAGQSFANSPKNAWLSAGVETVVWDGRRNKFKTKAIGKWLCFRHLPALRLKRVESHVTAFYFIGTTYLFAFDAEVYSTAWATTRPNVHLTVGSPSISILPANLGQTFLSPSQPQTSSGAMSDRLC